MLEELIIIGQISKPHGIRGEVKVIPMTTDVSRFKKLKTTYIDNIERTIEGCKFQKDRVILNIQGIDSMNEAEKYRNKYIYVTREKAVKLSEDEYYVADIIDCIVYDENGKNLGKIYDVLETGSNDVYWIKDKAGDLLIPALKSIIIKMDVYNKQIIIKPVEEWME